MAETFAGYQTESYVEMPVIIDGTERIYVLDNLVLRLKTAASQVFIDRRKFGPERALEMALIGFSGVPDRITNVHECLFLIMFAIEVKRLEQNPDVDPKHSALVHLFKRLPAVYAYLRESSVQLGGVVHINDRAA